MKKQHDNPNGILKVYRRLKAQANALKNNSKPLQKELNDKQSPTN